MSDDVETITVPADPSLGRIGDAPCLVIAYPDATSLLQTIDEARTRGVLTATVSVAPNGIAPGGRVSVRITFPGLLRTIELAGAVVDIVPSGDDSPVTVTISLRGEGEAAAAREEAEALIDRELALIRERDPSAVAQLVRVLVVEDNTHCARLIQDGLRVASRRAFAGRVAFHVPSCATVAAAMDAMYSEPFDLVITDVFLSQGDRGTQIITNMRADPDLAPIPVIAISADEEIAREEALRSGANLFMAKPVRLRQIASNVAELLHLPQSAWR